MPLHYAVGVKCKKGTTTENQGAGVAGQVATKCVLVSPSTRLTQL